MDVVIFVKYHNFKVSSNSTSITKSKKVMHIRGLIKIQAEHEHILCSLNSGNSRGILTMTLGA